MTMALQLISDIHPAMIGVCVSAIVCFLCYLIYRYGIREKSFEDVIEEQKRRSIEEEIQQKNEKNKKEKKFNKKWSKKKEKVDQVYDKKKDSVQEEEVKDEFDSEIEIIEPKEVKPKQKNKSKVDKVVTVNIPEKVPKTPPTVPEKTVQEKPIQQKAEAEIVKDNEKHAVDLKEVEVQKSSATVDIIVPKVTPPVPAVVNAETSTTSKKKKKETIDRVEAVKVSTTKLLTMIKETELETEESQAFIDILLNKQKDSASWTLGKKDQLTSTKKTLQEKEQLLEQETRQHQATMSKLKEVREEYNQMKSKSNIQDRQNQEKAARQHQEIQTLTLRIKQLNEQLTSEKEKVLEIKKSMKDEFDIVLKRADEEKLLLKQAVSKLESEVHNSSVKNEYESLKKSREDLQKVHSLLVEQHTQLVTSHKKEIQNTNVQVTELKTQLENINNKHATVLKEVQTLKEAKVALETTKQSLEDKLKVEQAGQLHNAQEKLQDVTTELESQKAQLKVQISDLKRQNTQLQANIQTLQAENDQLTDQLTSTKERVAGDGQEIVHQNGEFNGKAQEENYLKSLDEKDSLLKEKENLVVQLNEDLNKQKAKIALLDEEIEVQKQKNNDLREKNWKAMDALTNAEQKVKDTESAYNEKLLKVQAELKEVNFQATHSSKSSKGAEDLEAKLKEVENISAGRLASFNSEVEKNRHLTAEVQRISVKQDSSNLRIAEIQKHVESLGSELEKTKLNTKECLQRIFPELPIDNSLPHDAWLVEFEKQATVVLQASSSANNTSELQNRICALESEKNDSTSKLGHLEMALLETSATLQNLEKEAVVHNKEWEEKFTQKNKELQKVLEERDALSSEKEEFQSTFQQMGQLQKLQEKLKLLQATLETAENERSHLESKYEEVNMNCVNLRDQLENKEKLLTELQNDKRNEALQKELEDIKVKLEKEKKISKELSSNMIRLNSLVKIGQDSLTAEQETVKLLKSQLEAAQKGVGNGTSTAALPTHPVTISEPQPKVKGSEKSKKKMDASVKK